MINSLDPLFEIVLQPLIIWSTVRFILLLMIVAFIFLKCVHRYLKWRKFVAIIDSIPGPPSLGILGHAMLVVQLDRQQFEYGTYVLLYQMLSSTRIIYGKEKICRFWLGLRPLVILFTPEAIETILSSNTLTDKATEYNLLRPWLGDGLVTSNRIKWKLRRKILTPAFHFRILQDFLPVINEHADVLVHKLANIAATRGEIVEIMSVMTLCTLDVICETAMGIKVKCQETESEYVNALHQVSELILFRLCRPWFWLDSIFFNTPHGKRFKRCLRTMKEFTLKVIKERKEDWLRCRSKAEDEKKDQQSAGEGEILKTASASDHFFYGEKRRLAFLDLLLEQHLDNDNMSIEDVCDEVDTFMFAGHDTTAMGISWTLYLLGLHDDVQEKLFEEIEQITKNFKESQNQFTIDDIKQMKYLDCVLKEVQRLYPTAPFIGREITHDVEINGYLIPKGTTCGILTFLLHRDPVTFPKPEHFDPDRFMPSNCVKRHPFAYIPFSAGPRNCIGQKFALLEQKIIVANVIKHFKVKAIDHRDKLVVTGEMVLRSRNGLRLLLTSRNQQKETFVNQNAYDFGSDLTVSKAETRNL
ncbi:cytochrome P450 monooxygenase-like protein [Dinothrombium tinctorium]|uniref:Cytochrome P450 monooxygenase-like protein n=1 Tax=Dinothrombium tinctorium TaxID=1965070 RepID=A0A443RA17_9ACAR|nr:cytochrome P450 monooxygenase-like protein [Dinothrombium tinctorium]